MDMLLRFVAHFHSGKSTYFGFVQKLIVAEFREEGIERGIEYNHFTGATVEDLTHVVRAFCIEAKGTVQNGHVLLRDLEQPTIFYVC